MATTIFLVTSAIDYECDNILSAHEKISWAEEKITDLITSKKTSGDYYMIKAIATFGGPPVTIAKWVLKHGYEHREFPGLGELKGFYDIYTDLVEEEASAADSVYEYVTRWRRVL